MPENPEFCLVIRIRPIKPGIVISNQKIAVALRKVGILRRADLVRVTVVLGRLEQLVETPAVLRYRAALLEQQASRIDSRPALVMHDAPCEMRLENPTEDERWMSA